MKESTRYSTGRLMAEMRDTRYENGSALILAVVLTSLLAVLGVMFVMIARVDRIATSAISENKDLNSAVEAVIAKISQELVLDVPGMSKGREYYDYPDANNAWLASLEPHKDGSYKWRQISDVTGFLADNNYDADDVDVDPPGLRKYIPQYPKISVDSDGEFLDENGNPATEGLWADADGDGVADSKWVELDDMTSNKGRAIYAAVRIIDNGAMLNVNTAYKFDPTNPGPNGEMVDGSSQTQINLLALAQRNTASDAEDLDNLDEERFGSESRNMDNYLRDVVWRYYPPAEDTAYTPFDLSDELELRNRYTLNRSDIDSRIEEVWDSAFQAPNYLRTPVDSSSSLGDWEEEVYFDDSEPNADRDYSYRHIGTTYNMDRIIRPDGGKMLDVNTADADSIYETLKTALGSTDPNFGDVNDIAAQIAVNLVDYRDTDPNATTLDVDGTTYYGFERPCIYISELAHNFVKLTSLPAYPIGFTMRKSYAIELYKPYREDDYAEPNQWQLIIDNSRSSASDVNVPIAWSGTKHFHVIKFQDPCAALTVNFDLDDKDPNLGAPSAKEFTLVPNTVIFDGRSIIELQRLIDGTWVTVDDNRRIPRPGDKWLQMDTGPQSIRRDITLHKCIRRLWSSPLGGSTLGGANNYTDALNTEKIQAHPANEDFTNIGEIGMVFRRGAYYEDPANRPDRIGYDIDTDEEAEVRLDLADPDYSSIFKYLTVLDPTNDGIDNDGYIMGNDPLELKVPGRMNINTAPWFVIAQLPWVTNELAQAIVAYRDKLNLSGLTPAGPDYYHSDANDSRYLETAIPGLREADGFASIGELGAVIGSGADEYSMRYYTLGPEKGVDLTGFPDLTPGGSTGDGAPDDFEERDVIFARISNLVTVRSDVFTAYILVRIGADGPQKRVIAILDRSDVYPPNGGRVRVVALHPVADPR